MINEALLLLSLLLPNTSNVTTHNISYASTDYGTYVADSSSFTRIGETSFALGNNYEKH